MKQLPEVNASFENLYGMLIAPIRSKLLLRVECTPNNGQVVKQLLPFGERYNRMEVNRIELTEHPN